MGHESFRKVGSSDTVGQDGADEGGLGILEGRIELATRQGRRGQGRYIGEAGEDVLVHFHGSREKVAVSFRHDGCRCHRLRIMRRSDAELDRTHRRGGWKEEDEERYRNAVNTSGVEFNYILGRRLINLLVALCGCVCVCFVVLFLLALSLPRTNKGNSQ